MSWQAWFPWMVALAVSVAAQEPPTARMDVFPPEVHLDGAIDRPALVVTVTREDATTEDVTEEAEVILDDRAVAAFRDGRLTPLRDGRTVARVRYAGMERLVRIEVVGAAEASAPSFRKDVLPVLTRQGCNAGGCHGAAAGKAGFRLSLFGYDPVADHARVTRELRGRRIDLVEPRASLILRKPLLELPHGGGRRLERDSPAYSILDEWIARGAPEAPNGPPPDLVDLEIGPKDVCSRSQDALAGGRLRQKTTPSCTVWRKCTRIPSRRVWKNPGSLRRAASRALISRWASGQAGTSRTVVLSCMK